MIDTHAIARALDRRMASPTCSFWDVAYSCPTRRWVNGEFSEAFRARIFTLGLIWRKEKSDCNTFALEAMSHARQCHLKSDGEGQLAFGMMLYFTRTGEYHAINIYLENNGGVIEPFAYEPQVQKTVELTDEEWKSCTNVLF